MTVTISYRVVGRYLMCEAFASGGMASVHLGRLLGGEGFSRTIAIKQLYPHFARDREFVHMFLDEARLLSRIRHPHVVAPLDVLRIGSELFIIMEYVHGASLARLLEAQRGAVSLPIASGLIQQTLLGLHAAHEAADENGTPLALVHRDVSPQNILVDAHGSVRVVDFGIAKAASQARTTQEGRLKGKPGYLAPEQLRFEAADRRADIFNAGIVLWELLAGESLFSGASPLGALERIGRGEISAPSHHNAGVPPELDAVVLRALCSRPDERFASAREMALALMQASPAAAPIEIGSWVESLIAAELRTREQAILAMELISPSDLTQVLPPQVLSPQATPSRVRAASSALETPMEPTSRTPGGGVVPVNTRQTPSAPQGVRSRVAKLGSLASQHAGSLILSTALTIVILFAYDAAFRRAPAVSLSPAPLEPSRETPALLPQPLPLPQRASLPLSPHVEAPRKEAPPTAAPLAASSAVERANAMQASAAARRRPSAPPSPPPRLEPKRPPAPEHEARAPVAGALPPTPPQARRPCREDELFTVDERGVKRWKKDRPECYTWSTRKGGR